jgi:hypothetical protein
VAVRATLFVVDHSNAYSSRRVDISHTFDDETECGHGRMIEHDDLEKERGFVLSGDYITVGMQARALPDDAPGG